MTSIRQTSLVVVALVAAAGCGKSRTVGTESTSVTIPGGAVDGSDVTVDASGCVRCHGDEARAPAAGDAAGVAFAPPIDVSRATTGAKVGAHMAHLRPGTLRGSGVDCASCHYVPQNAGQHGPGVHLRGLAATVWSGAPPITPAYDPATSSCSNTYCHGAFPGGNARTVTWTGGSTQADCGTCHDLPPAVLPDGTTPHPASFTCGNCHPGYGPGQVDLTLHVNGEVDGGCTGCHGDGTRTAGGMVGVTYDPNLQAAPPVDHNLASSSILVGAHLAHVNPDGTGVYKPILCSECHPDSTAATHQNGTPNVTFANATAADLAGFTPGETPSSGTTAATCTSYCHNGPNAAGYGGSATAWSWDGAPATCGSCHGDPPATSGHVGLTATSDCGACHPGYTATTVDIATHLNGRLDGGESIGGQSCGGCHSTIFSAMNGTVAKAFKHTLGATSGTNDSPTDSGITWGSPLATSNAAAARSCVNMCHGDHPHDLTSPVVATHEYNAYLDSTSGATRGGATRTSATRAKTDFVAAETNGGLCTSCHRNPIATGGPTISVATYGASAHDFTAASGSTWRYQLHSGSFDRNCTKCHASATEGTTPLASASSSGANSVHFNANPSLLAGSLTLSASVTDLVCYNCHGSAAAPANGAQGNRSGKNIQSQFAKANAHIGTGVTCLSCHAPHQAKAGTHATPGNLAGPPIEGASGARFPTSLPAFWTPPAAGAFTATTIAAGTDVEATLCFKCHSAFGTLPAGTTDTAMEFNPNNVGNFGGTWAANESAGGFHPVLATAGSNLGAINLANLVTTNQPWSTSARNLMTCTDCHESETTTDPNGPHGSAAGFILKGPNTLWNNTMAATSTGMPAGAFCANCHSATWTSSRFTGTQHYSRSEHRVPCMNCHAAIPHGGPRPGMLVGPAGTAAGVPVYAGWDGAAPYSTPGTGSRLYIKSYPATQGNTWGQSNCGCNGTGH